MELGVSLIVFGSLLLASLALDALGRLTRLPRITLLVLFGVLIGPSVLGLVPDGDHAWRDIVATLALTMIAFLLGGELSRKTLVAHGRAILAVSISVTLVSFAVVGTGLVLAGAPVAVAVLLAGIGLATDPAATGDVVREIRARGRVTKTLLGVVAIDDAWGVIIFSMVLGLLGVGNGLVAGLREGVIEVATAITIGIAIGLPASYATGRIRQGQPTLIEALGIVLLTAGVSLWLEVSYLLAGIAAGAVIVNFARHHEYAFHEIERASWPFLILFFVMAGVSADLGSLAGLGLIGLAFVVLRIAARLIGSLIGGRLGGLSTRQSWLLGLTLFPQAGVALGMALVAAAAVPEHAETVMSIAVVTTVLFELLGPIAARMALRKAGEAEG